MKCKALGHCLRETAGCFLGQNDAAKCPHRSTNLCQILDMRRNNG